jgi:pimeloyl-ACP methyl ester carboxylesterase
MKFHFSNWQSLQGADASGAEIASSAKSLRTNATELSLAATGKRSLLQRILRKSAAQLYVLPHANFSHTSMGVKSMVSAGCGGPTVVFESGLGQGKRTWAPVFSAIAAMTRAVAYDRAGYGQSERSKQSRDGLQIVLELRDMLQTENIAPPYVLVGHSLGGTYMKLFAKTFPDEVAGVVLVDARHAEFTQRCRQLGIPRLLYQPPDALLAMLAPVARAELEAAPLTLKQTRRAGPFPSVPLIVLTQSTATSRWPKGLKKVWEASQQNMAKMSKLGRIKICQDAGHHVHEDRPDVVVSAVLNVVRAARYVASKDGTKGA